MAFFVEKTHHITKSKVYLKDEQTWDSRVGCRKLFDTEEEANAARTQARAGTVVSE